MIISLISYNRWLYTYAQPINNTDPSGLMTYSAVFAEFKDDDDYENKTAPRWTSQDMSIVNQALGAIAVAYAKAYNKEAARRGLIAECPPNNEFELYIDPTTKKIDPFSAFFGIHGGKVTVWKHSGGAPDTYGGASTWGTGPNSNTLNIWSPGHFEKKVDYLTLYGKFGINVASDNYGHFVTHEMGHVFDHAIGDEARRELGKGMYSDLVSGGNTTANGFYGPKLGYDINTWLGWQWRYTTGPEEYFADMYVGWVYGRWEQISGTSILAKKGRARSDFMSEYMPGWIYKKIEGK